MTHAETRLCDFKSLPVAWCTATLVGDHTSFFGLRRQTAINSALSARPMHLGLHDQTHDLPKQVDHNGQNSQPSYTNIGNVITQA
jgi:hypothetical protein